MMKITGYGDRYSVRPGETVRFMVSCDGLERYRADIVRVINGDTNPAGPGFNEELVETPVNGDYPGHKQEINAGSYVAVSGGASVSCLTSIHVQAMIWPTTPEKREQALIAKWAADEEAGFALTIDTSGCLALKIGDGAGQTETVSTGVALLAREWYFVAASFDAADGHVTLVQECLARYARTNMQSRVVAKVGVRPAMNNGAPLMMGAWQNRQEGDRIVAAAHYNGKIDMPRIAARPLSADEMMVARATAAPHLEGVLIGAWDFSKEIDTTRVIDTSPNQLHGEVINLPARAMKGHNWTGQEMNWTNAPEQYGAIHFHDDDIYDAGWQADFEFTVPKALKSGFYAARFTAGAEEERVPFFVVPPKDRANAPLALLVPTASYMAYANDHGMLMSADAELGMGRLVVLQPQDLFLGKHPEFGRSLYDTHADGSGVCLSSRLRPMLNMRPKYQSWNGAMGSSLWQYNADTHIVAWLEATGQSYDVITDEELHAEGSSLLARYRAVMTCSHPEYYSTDMLDSVQTYVNDGGRLIYMGSNGFYWRIAFHKSLPGVIEVRRAEGGCRTWHAEPGEYYHSFSGEFGGLWLRQGRPPQKLVGVGFTAEGFDLCSYYLRASDSFDPRAAFIFDGVGKDERIGDFGLIGGGAAGLEIDRADRALGTPPHALVLASSKEHTDNYLVVPEDIYCMRLNITASTSPLVRADMVFYETPGGGAVFSTGSIAWSGSLLHNGCDNNVSRVTQNVVRRFVSDEPFTDAG
jgi:N,N-dimethylformamidase